MKKTLLYIILAAMTLAVSSCFKFDPVVYNQRDIVMVNGSTLISDYGFKYNVLEEPDAKWRSMDRVYIKFDMLESISDEEYNIRINDYTEFKIQEIQMAADSTEASLFGSDPIYPVDAFVTGTTVPFLNISCVYVTKSDSKAEHNVSLVYDSARSKDKNIVMHIAHNSNGDYFKEGDKATDFVQAQVNISVPATSIIKSGSGSTDLEFDYRWYLNDGSTALSETVGLSSHMTVN